MPSAMDGGGQAEAESVMEDDGSRVTAGGKRAASSATAMRLAASDGSSEADRQVEYAYIQAGLE